MSSLLTSKTSQYENGVHWQLRGGGQLYGADDASQSGLKQRNQQLRHAWNRIRYVSIRSQRCMYTCLPCQVL